MSNCQHDDHVVRLYSGGEKLFDTPKCIQGSLASASASVHVIDPTLFPTTRNKITHEWAMRSFGSFYVFDDEQNISGNKVVLKRMTDKSLYQWKALAEEIHDALFMSGKQAVEDEMVKLANDRGITTPANQNVTSADDVFKSFQETKLMTLFHKGKKGEQSYFSHGFVIVREVYHKKKLGWATDVVKEFESKYCVRFGYKGKKTGARKNCALKVATACSGYYMRRLIQIQARAVNTYWCERKAPGKKTSKDLWSQYRLPEQSNMGICKSGYKVVVRPCDDVSTITGDTDVSVSVLDLCRMASSTGIAREEMITMVEQAYDNGEFIFSLLYFRPCHVV